MRIRRIELEGIRGIKKLHWDVAGEVVCLIAPGDSTQTTILDAIDLAPSPRCIVPFDHADLEAQHPAQIAQDFVRDNEDS